MLHMLTCNLPGPWSYDAEDTEVPAHRVTVSPATIDFGHVSVNGEGARTATFTVFNLGASDETVTGHDEALGDAAFTVDEDVLLSLAPGEERTITVTFAPTTEAHYAAQIIVDPADETVDLSGSASAPVLVTGALEMDAVVVGCNGTGTVSLANTGSERLEIEEVSTSTTEFAATTTPVGLGPGEESEVTVRFTPTGGGQRGANLLLRSNDPLHPELSVPLSVLGYEGERVEESFRYTPANPTDILFVVDTGAGMEDHLIKATDVLGAYVDALREANLDYQITAISSADPCPSGSPAWAGRSDTSLRTEHVVERAFASERGTWEDDLLSLATEALERTRAGDCLEGFRREDADLQVILVTDGPMTGSVESQLESLEEEVAPTSLRLGALLPRGGCAQDLDVLDQAITRRGGLVEDLCDTDWSDAFSAFATLPPGNEMVSFPMAEVPVPSTIEVDVEGSPWSGAWSYEPDENAVLFDGTDTPALGAEVTIRYVSAVTCD